MSEPFVGEVRMVGFNFAPVGWFLCDGQLLSISQNEVLFNLIGTIYGGDGQSTFALPNLQGRIPIHQGTSDQGTWVMGQSSGTETVTLSANEMPEHSHLLSANSGAGTQSSPSGGVWAESSLNQFSGGSATEQMAATSLGSSGSSQSHDNMPPYTCINFVIANVGIFPSQS
jgi:microcystin-dependent protein